MRVSSVALIAGIALMALTASPGAQQTPRNAGAPEVFSANANVKGAAGAISATILVDINRYSPDFDRESVEKAL